MSRDKIGVKADSYIDGKAKRWSWKCACGDWDDGYPGRKWARSAYREHKRACKAVMRRVR